jgi:ComF family protein
VGLLLPAPCLSCGTPLPAGRTPLGLCGACRGKLRRLRATACALCARPLRIPEAPPGWRCSTCREHPPAFDRLLGLWSYEPPLDTVILALKFRRLEYLAEHLAEALGRELGDDLRACDLAVPVPLHWRRRLARGYNQAERIARHLAGLARLPLVPALARRRATPAQSRLGRPARLANLRGAFRVRRPAAVHGRHVLLVDDVATTGATLDAAAATLKLAGATAVTALVAARTLAEG